MASSNQEIIEVKGKTLSEYIAQCAEKPLDQQRDKCPSNWMTIDRLQNLKTMKAECERERVRECDRQVGPNHPHRFTPQGIFVVGYQGELVPAKILVRNGVFGFDSNFSDTAVDLEWNTVERAEYVFQRLAKHSPGFQKGDILPARFRLVKKVRGRNQINNEELREIKVCTEEFLKEFLCDNRQENKTLERVTLENYVLRLKPTDHKPPISKIVCFGLNSMWDMYDIFLGEVCVKYVAVQALAKILVKTYRPGGLPKFKLVFDRCNSITSGADDDILGRFNDSEVDAIFADEIDSWLEIDDSTLVISLEPFFPFREIFTSLFKPIRRSDGQSIVLPRKAPAAFICTALHVNRNLQRDAYNRGVGDFGKLYSRFKNEFSLFGDDDVHWYIRLPGPM